MKTAPEEIAILDFGSQYSHLIARRFRELGVMSRLYPTNYDLSQIDNLIGVVFSGSPGSLNEQKYPFNPAVFKLKLPVLGLCYGLYLIAKHFGGQVSSNPSGEYGLANLQVGQSILFAGLAGGEVVWMSHSDSVAEAPPTFKVIGSTEHCPIAAIASADESAKIFGLQFHPEVTHTVHGLQILKNFAYKVCGAQKSWSIADWQQQIISQIQEQASGKKVFLLVSGGVDSTVCFALLEKALGPDRVYGLHLDTGLMRQNEVEQVKGSLGQAGFKNLHIRDASQEFLSALAGVFDPEEKRKIIGQLFLDIKDGVSQELNLNPKEWLLAQGTIYPDTIESGGTVHADTIKTHHNRVDRIQQLIASGQLIEPVRDLYKDEVRQLGQLLGLPPKIIWRQPFPGPGLAIRALCSSGQLPLPQEEITDINQQLTRVFNKIKICERLVQEDQIQALPIRSVGVQGDYRTYSCPAALEIKNPDWLKIERFSPQITNLVKKVNRVLLRIDGQKFSLTAAGPVEAAITKKRLDLLRQIDSIVQEEMLKAKLEQDIWQFPVILLPFGIGEKESVVLRPVSSLEAMTARFYPLADNVLQSMVARINQLKKTSFIFFDATNKPPGTIEWE